MGAARLVLTVGVVGVAAGAFLAIAIVPSLTPFKERPPVIVHQDYVETAPYGYQPPAVDAAGDEDERIDAGSQDGAWALDMPRWAEETGKWVQFGERALQTWRIWSQPEDYARDEYTAPRERLERFGRRGDWRDEAPDGYAEERPERWYSQNEPGAIEAYPVEPSPVDPGQLEPEAPRSYGRAPSSERSLGYADRAAPADAAAEAARRAQDAARDVRAAQDDE